MASRMHLPSLTVKEFRGIRALDLPSLGRVTLLSGKNSIGKTTVLEAIRVFASRGDNRNLFDLLGNREEFVTGDDADGDPMDFPDFASLFHNYLAGAGRGVPSTIKIAARCAADSLSLQLVEADEQPFLLSPNFSLKTLCVAVGEHERTIPVDPIGYTRTGRRGYFSSRMMASDRPETWPIPIKFESMGPGLLDNDEISRLWDEVALTPSEDDVIRALRLVVGDELDRIGVIGDRSSSYQTHGRRVVAKLKHLSAPIPLKRLGDGAQRLFGIALALANCRNGILIIDEVENGIHHSVHRDLWHMIFRAAEEGNVQVVAATHSWDCIAGFAGAACETRADGTLYRLERFEDDLHAVRYSKRDLEVAALQRIEVR